MNLIDFLKFKTLMEQTNELFEFKINDDDSVDIVSHNVVFFLDFPKIYEIYSLKYPHLSFKIRNFYGNILGVFGCKDHRIYLTNLQNFPDYCSGDLKIFDDNIKVASLIGLGRVDGGVVLNLCDRKEYKTKEDILKVYPNLNIGNYLNIGEHTFDFMEKK